MIGIARRRIPLVTGGGLTEVEWLGTDGSCEVITDFVPNSQSYTIEGKYYYNGFSVPSSQLPRDVAWFGAWDFANGSSVASYRISSVYGLDTLVLCHNDEYSNMGGPIFNVSKNTDYTFTLTPSTYTFNGQTDTHKTPHIADNIYPLILIDLYFVGKFYNLKFEIDGVAVVDYVPVRKNGVGYIYDKVNGNLYGTTSGTLTIGPDKIN